MEEQKYTDKDLSDDEKIQAQFNVDSLEVNLKVSKFDIEMMEQQVEKMIPQRQAGIAAKEAIMKKKAELKQFEEQFKMYQRRVRTGKKKVPVMNNTPMVPEVVPTAPAEEKPDEITK